MYLFFLELAMRTQGIFLKADQRLLETKGGHTW